jgi:alpha-tubulin suppressor-like RCC1 family protein
VTGLAVVAAIAAGGNHSLAVKSDGTVWGWDTAGDWNRGTCSFRRAPALVSGLSGVEAVVAGFDRSDLALKRDRTVWEWGTFGLSPVEVKGLTNVAP